MGWEWPTQRAATTGGTTATEAGAQQQPTQLPQFPPHTACWASKPQSTRCLRVQYARVGTPRTYNPYRISSIEQTMLQAALDTRVLWVAACLRMVAGRSSMSCCRTDAPRTLRGTEAVRRDHDECYRRRVWIAAVARCVCQRGCRKAGSRHRSCRFAGRAAAQSSRRADDHHRCARQISRRSGMHR